MAEKFRIKKVPILTRRDKVVEGVTTDFEEHTYKFNSEYRELEQAAMINSIKTEEEMLASAERNLLHMPADVDDLE